MKKQTDEEIWKMEHYMEYVEKYKGKYFGSELWKVVKKDSIPEPKIKRSKPVSKQRNKSRLEERF